MINIRWFVSVAIAFSILAEDARSAVVIDSFTTPQSASLLLGDRNTADGPGIIGGERDFVTILSMSANEAVPGELRISTLGGGAGGDISYDGNDNDPSSSSFGGMGSIDLTQGGVNDRFRFDFSSASNVPATLLIDVKNFGVGAALQVNLPTSAGVFYVPFDSFPSTAVFHTVGLINLHFEVHGEGSFTIDSITATVPEPAAAPLILAAILGCGVYRRNVLIRYRR